MILYHSNGKHLKQLWIGKSVSPYCSAIDVYSWLSLLRRPNACDPTLVGTNLLLPIPPERFRKSAKRWVTHVAVLQARFCAVMLKKQQEHEHVSMQTNWKLFWNIWVIMIRLVSYLKTFRLGFTFDKIWPFWGCFSLNKQIDRLLL